MTVNDLPAINATLNAVSTLLLAGGYILIKCGHRDWHRRFMLAALVVSAAFLSCYLVYHYHVGSKPFPELGWIKTVYLIILIPHIILAAVMVPMILKTFWHAFRGEWESHKQIARWTFPIWMYVSITGVLIYFMLYLWFAPPAQTMVSDFGTGSCKTINYSNCARSVIPWGYKKGIRYVTRIIT